MKIIKLVNRILNKFNAQILRYPSVDLSRRKKIIDCLEISVVLDVGASVGNFGLELFELGYQGNIVSFEPISDAFTKLELNTKKRKNWLAFNYALGDFDGDSTINLSTNSDSSSILDMLPLHLDTAPQSKYVSKEKILIKKLDSIYKEICKESDNVYLKIDTQGFEQKVLDGGSNSLKMIKAIQIEMSLRPLYKNSVIYKDIIYFLEKNGYKLVSIENGFFNSLTGELLQFDGIFIKA